MDPTEARLRAAIFAAPADDAPRAVYADWLIERGDPYGEFIALQLRSPAKAAKRIAELVEQLGEDRLCGPLADSVDDHVYERGFLANATVFDHAEPAVEWATLHTVWMWVPASDEHPMPILRTARALSAEALAALGDLTVRPPLAHITLRDTLPATFTALARVLPQLPALEHLEIADTAFDDYDGAEIERRDLSPTQLPGASSWLPAVPHFTLPSHPRHLAAWFATHGPERLTLTPNAGSFWTIDFTRTGPAAGALSIAPHGTPTLDDIDVLVDALAVLPADSVAPLSITGIDPGRWRAITRRKLEQRVLARQPRIDARAIAGFVRTPG